MNLDIPCKEITLESVSLRGYIIRQRTRGYLLASRKHLIGCFMKSALHVYMYIGSWEKLAVYCHAPC